MTFMKIYGVHSSISENCGISIFNMHVKKAIINQNIQFETLNISECYGLLPDDSTVILHYVPSAFSDTRRSNFLISLLKIKYFKKLIVIFHGAYKINENRYNGDTFCPYQKEHLRLIFEKADFLISLSESLRVNLNSWLELFSIRKKIITLDHPGLFVKKPSIKIDIPYIFLGGISRMKKNGENLSTEKLISECKEKKIPIWMHWTNLNSNSILKNNVWKQTNGLLSDQLWCNIISNSKVVICPYETQIQTVSGIIAEALSANRYVLTTAFDFALEMQLKYPSLVIVNNQITQWPNLLENLLNKVQHFPFDYYNWSDFGSDLVKILSHSPEYILT